MPLGKNFRRPQIFSPEISGPKRYYFVNFRSIRCTGRSGPLSAPGPVTSASSASWMIRPCCNPQKATLCAKHVIRRIDHSTHFLHSSLIYQPPKFYASQCLSNRSDTLKVPFLWRHLHLHVMCSLDLRDLASQTASQLVQPHWHSSRQSPYTLQ